VASTQAQSLTGTITGGGMPMEDVPVELTNTASKTVFKTKSAEDGSYSFASLPAGAYDLWIPPQGFFFRHFERRGLSVGSEPQRLDISLEEQLNSVTPGENPLDIVAGFQSRMTPQPGPTPRMADGKPDFSGTWLVSFEEAAPPPDPPSLPWAAELVKEGQRRNGVDSNNTRCLPASLPLNFLFKLVHAGNLLVVLVEDVFGFRQIYIDGREHPENWNPSYFGHSVGHWEGETLVVETVGITDRSWLGFPGHPHTEGLRMIERFRRPEKGRLELETTFLDPGTFSKPWIIPAKFDLAPAEDILEYVCENDRDAGHYRN
jgi:hypothetical protein